MMQILSGTGPLSECHLNTYFSTQPQNLAHPLLTVLFISTKDNNQKLSLDIDVLQLFLGAEVLSDEILTVDGVVTHVEFHDFRDGLLI